jgi:DNA invertase Pin-like site-specific DNA recombinase
MTTYAYARVSTEEQNEARQLEVLKLAGYTEGKLYVEKASGKDTNRPELQALIKAVDKNDVVIVSSMDRLARSLKDLMGLVEAFTNNGVAVKFIKENLTFSGEDNPIAKLQLAILGGVAEFERALIKSRQREGILIAKEKGVYKGRKPIQGLADKMLEIKTRIANGETKSSIAKELKISRETLYQYLAKTNQLNS